MQLLNLIMTFGILIAVGYIAFLLYGIVQLLNVALRIGVEIEQHLRKPEDDLDLAFELYKEKHGTAPSSAVEKLDAIVEMRDQLKEEA